MVPTLSSLVAPEVVMMTWHYNNLHCTLRNTYNIDQQHNFLWIYLKFVSITHSSNSINACVQMWTDTMILCVNSLRPSDGYICVSKLTITGSDNGLSPNRRQAIIWTNAGILLIGPLGTNISETLIEIHTFSLKKMHLKMSSGKWSYKGYQETLPCL